MAPLQGALPVDSAQDRCVASAAGGDYRGGTAAPLTARSTSSILWHTSPAA